MIDEKSFHPGFLASLSAFELAVLQHELRTFTEDAPYLAQVLGEFKRRSLKTSEFIDVGADVPGGGAI